MRVAGFGFRGSATVDSLRSAFALAEAQGVSALAVPMDKSDAPAFRAFAGELALPVVSVAPAELEMADTVTRSPRVMAERGTGSVAEGVAIAAAGPGARLLGARVVSADRMATCAIAQLLAGVMPSPAWSGPAAALGEGHCCRERMRGV